MKVEIEVTREDIKAGIPEEGNSCPVALAICRALGVHRLFVYAGNRYLELDQSAPCGFQAGNYTWPDVAADFIHRFDEDGTGEPFRFTLSDTESPR